MPRAKAVSDDDVLSGALKVILTQGPIRFSLHHVGQEVGLSPATLLQRFGSKEDLLVRAIALANARLRGELECYIEQAEEETGSPCASIINLLVRFAGFVKHPDEIAQGLDILKIDMLDPAMNAVSKECFDIRHQALVRLLERACRAKEVSAETNLDHLASILESIWQGTIMFWGIYKDGALEELLRRNCAFVLKK